MKRKHIQTSSDAHDSVKEHKAILYEKIKDGLRRLKIGGTFAEIAVASDLRPEQVWKRLSEMQGEGMIYNTGITRKLPSGRQGSVWQLVGLQSYDNVKKEELPKMDKRFNEPTPKKKATSLDINLTQNPLFS